MMNLKKTFVRAAQTATHDSRPLVSGLIIRDAAG
jgi:hypothetical protein